MPIPKKELKKAQEPLDKRILEFLKQDSANAYTVVEVFAAVEGYQPSIAEIILLSMTMEQRRAYLRELHEALDRMVTEGILEAALVRGTPHYAVK